MSQITKEGQACRKCGTPVIKKNPRKIRENTKYYYEWYLLCPKCRTMYMVEEARREHTSKPVSKPLMAALKKIGSMDTGQSQTNRMFRQFLLALVPGLRYSIARAKEEKALELAKLLESDVQIIEAGGIPKFVECFEEAK